MTPAGFPHSDIHGSTLESSSPWHFAGFHVLLRLLVPRHPPCALCSLTISGGCCDHGTTSTARHPPVLPPPWSRKPPSDGSNPRFLSSPGPYSHDWLRELRSRSQCLVARDSPLTSSLSLADRMLRLIVRTSSRRSQTEIVLLSRTR